MLLTWTTWFYIYKFNRMLCFTKQKCQDMNLRHIQLLLLSWCLSPYSYESSWIFNNYTVPHVKTSEYLMVCCQFWPADPEGGGTEDGGHWDHGWDDCGAAGGYDRRRTAQSWGITHLKIIIWWTWHSLDFHQLFFIELILPWRMTQHLFKRAVWGKETSLALMHKSCRLLVFVLQTLML